MIHGSKVLFPGTLQARRAEALGLPAREDASIAGTLYGYSQHVLAKPGDWGDEVAVTGYWFLDSKDWEPDPDLAAFLAAGDPPIYVGFGSMPGADPKRLTEMVVEGLRRAGKRGLLATGGGALRQVEIGNDMHVVAGAPDDKLFPLLHATLHHGGAGTTGAALPAGKPSARRRSWRRHSGREWGGSRAPLHRAAADRERTKRAITHALV